MDLHDFRSLFGESIRALVAWDEIDGSEVSIRHSVLTDRAQIGRLLTLWYVDAAGRPGDWRDPGSTPLTVGQAARTSSARQAGAAQRIERFQRKFLRGEPPVLLVPAFEIRDRVLILDGSLRVLSIYKSDVVPRVLVCAITGTIRSKVLPDVERWSAVLE